MDIGREIGCDIIFIIKTKFGFATRDTTEHFSLEDVSPHPPPLFFPIHNLVVLKGNRSPEVLNVTVSLL